MNKSIQILLAWKTYCVMHAAAGGFELIGKFSYFSNQEPSISWSCLLLCLRAFGYL